MRCDNKTDVEANADEDDVDDNLDVNDNVSLIETEGKVEDEPQAMESKGETAVDDACSGRHGRRGRPGKPGCHQP